MNSPDPAANWGVIFDMDGVLVDSFKPHYDSWQTLAGEVGATYTDEAFLRTFGRTGREIMLDEWKLQLPLEQIDRLVERKEQLYRELVLAKFPVMDGARELISALHAAGARLAIGSSGPPGNVNLAVERLEIGSLMSAWVTGKDVSHGKPHPEVFLTAAARLGLEPQRCVVIEDSPPGIEAGRRAGMAVVGLISTGHTPADSAHATIAVHSLRELTPARLKELVDSQPSVTTAS